mgnify:CR=1 FL=1
MQEGKQFYHNKPTSYKWSILPISVGVTQPEIFCIKYDDADAPIEPNNGFALKCQFVRISDSTITIDSDFCWMELTEDNIFDYDGSPVTDITTLYQTLTATTF